jgi:hypothetical protein
VRSKKEMEILGYCLVAILLSTEVWCGYRLRQIIRYRSEERTEARRAAFRAKAYKDMNERWRLKKRRETLFKSIEK